MVYQASFFTIGYFFVVLLIVLSFFCELYTATRTALNSPGGVSGFDRNGSFYISDTSSFVVRKVFSNGTSSIVAGTLGIAGNSTGGGQATSALMRAPRGLAVTSNGDLLIADGFPASVLRILYVSTNSTIATFAGTLGTSGNSGDGGAGESTLLPKLCFKMFMNLFLFCLFM